MNLRVHLNDAPAFLNGVIVKDIFKSQPGIFSLSMTFIQQLIVASSSYWLVMLAESAANGQISLGYFVAFFASLTTVYVPGALAQIGLEKWKQALYKIKIDQFLNSYRGRIDLIANAETRQTKHSFFARESFSVIDMVTHYFSGLIATALNVGFNIIVIAAVLDWSLLFAYSASAMISFFLVKRAMRISEAMASTAQIERVALSDVIMNSWSTVLVKNAHNYDLLKRQMEDVRLKSEQASVSARRMNEIVGLRTGLLAMVPVVGTMTFIVVSNYSNTALMMGLIATLHRQVMIIQFIESLVHSGIEYGSIKGLWVGLQESLKAPQMQNLNDRISSDLPRPQIPEGGKGRFTLRGPNGSGKSSYLMQLKNELGDQAYYLPAHVDFPFEGKTHSLSSGQKIAMALQEIEARTASAVYLLDEWDANLDQNLLMQIDAVINRLAERACVIEVRHRG